MVHRETFYTVRRAIIDAQFILKGMLQGVCISLRPEQVLHNKITTEWQWPSILYKIFTILIILLISRSAAFIQRLPLSQRLPGVYGTRIGRQVVFEQQHRTDIVPRSTANMKRKRKQSVTTLTAVACDRPGEGRTARSRGRKVSTLATEYAHPHDEDDDAIVIDKHNLLQQWAIHSKTSFHSFHPNEAVEIRSRLLEWYYKHRRKLPWRGDPPPWNGSTANFARVVETEGSPFIAREKKGTKQTKMDPFLGITPDEIRSYSDATTTSALPETSDRSMNGTKQYPVTAYGVWISEIMLQQTRVEAVIPYWIRWMNRFPTVDELATASPEEVNSYWTGLGFYRRVRLLHQASKLIVDQYGGTLPNTMEGLRKLPGIGRYTASAIASIAYNVPVPVVDGNVCRVLSRLKGIAQHVKSPALKDQFGWDLANEIIQAGTESPGDVNQALMELGATYCSPSGTGLDDNDPLKDFYWSTQIAQQALTLYKEGTLEDVMNMAQDTARRGCKVCASCGIVDVLEQFYTLFNETNEILGHKVFPLSPPKANRREEVYAVAVLERDEDGAWLLMRRPDVGLLAGQWEFPSVCIWNCSSVDNDGYDDNAGVEKGSNHTNPKKVVAIPRIPKANRSSTLTKYLRDIHSPLAKVRRQNVGKNAIEHIFSHIRHTLWVEYGRLGSSGIDDHHSDSNQNVDEWLWNGRRVRWMTEADMKQVGLTSGVKKILKAVHNTKG